MNTIVRRLEHWAADRNAWDESTWSQHIDRMTDDELAEMIMTELAALEAQGVKLPTGWSGQPRKLSNLKMLLDSAKAQITVMGRQRQTGGKKWHGFSAAAWISVYVALPDVAEVRSWQIAD